MICTDILLVLLAITSFVEIPCLPATQAFTVPAIFSSARLISQHRISPPRNSFLSSHQQKLELSVSDSEDQKQQRNEESTLKCITDATATAAADANASTRRIFFSSVLLTAAATLTPPNANAESITWSPSPINKRSGISLTQAEQIYNIRFITYLSRFLLSFDEECQKWWYRRASDIPRTATTEQVEALRRKQFAMFAASVEVSLQEFEGDGSVKGGNDGPRELMQSLLKRYGQDWEDLQLERVEKGLPPLKSGSEEEKYKREIREARRQIALLFGLLKTYQPVDLITKLLATLDNGKVERVEILNSGGGYAPGYGAPLVTFSAPDAGENFEVAQGRAVLRPSGRILRIDVDADLNKRGSYSVGKPPLVTVTPPLAAAIGSPFAKTATVKAFVVRDGVNKGKIEKIEVVNPGAGYAEDETIIVTVAPSPVDTLKVSGNSTHTAQVCTAIAVVEYEVSEIEITNPGSGYATEKPLEVMVDPPPATARVNLDDPLIAKDISLMKQTAKGSDEPVVAMAYSTAVSDSFTGFRMANDNKAKVFETSLMRQKISAAGDEASTKPLPFWTGGITSSTQLLSLLPAGIGLIYNRDAKRYELVAGDEVLNYGWADAMSPGKPIDPDFGPRGRSPIEREKKLDTGTLLRFYLSGALCSSSVHLVLTPIDVIKTNMQTNPDKYKGPLTAFKIVLEEKGLTGFFAGWVPTFIGFFINGGVSYTAIEFFRRYYSDVLGDLAQNYEIPIILASSVS